MNVLSALFGTKQKNEPKAKEENQLEGLIDKDVVESRYPFVFELNREYIASSGNYIKPYVILSYPSEPTGNWLSPLKRLKGNITITQHLEPANGEILNRHYNETVKNKEAELLKTLDHMRREQIKRELSTAKKQLEQSLDEKSAFIYLYTYILLQAHSEAELKSLEESLNRVLIKINLKGITPYRRIDDAYFSSFPIGLNELKEYTYAMTNTVSASSFFPFDDNEICDLTPTSTIEGINKETNSWIAIDYKDRGRTLNRNKIVLGTSGGGKSTYLKSNIFRKIAEGEDNIYIIDPEDEYSEDVLKFGGTVIDLSSASATRMNSYEILSQALDSDDDNISRVRQLTDTEVDNLIRQKVNRLKGFHKVNMPEMDQVQLSIISNESMKLYGVFREKKDLDLMEKEDWPILNDHLKALKALKETDIEKYKLIERYCFILEDMVEGSSTLFNGYTNVDLSSKLISFNLKPLQTEKEIQAAAYLNTFSYLWELITSNKSRSDELFCDEFHFLLKNPESADFFFQAYKRFRKYNAGATVTTQQIQDLLDALNGIGEAIVGNSYTKIMFGFEPSEVNQVIDRLKIPLSDKEIHFLQAKKQGEALILYGAQRALLKVVLTEEELRLLNPKKYEEKTGRSAKELPDWSDKVLLSQNEINQITHELNKVEGF
ncbi:conjugal transfer protein [Robertmurraya korlensis]|uniref:VirB4 family type IV secretion system protein n=1 Tax=Robertmurraya korlensis TaxID=519977 RepID=UPI00203E3D7B|nr:conjugal transfer protein [Robertmurraya korlensis]MCM3603121.1 conjugal transfer protein [Robertmurraya korlensis]